MTFLVIEFVEGGLAVVPSNWVTPRKKEVYWPPIKDTNSFKKLLQKDNNVADETWKFYEIEKIHCESENLETAERKLKKAGETSNLDTSDEEHLPLKRKRNSKALSSSESEDESKVKRPPPIKIVSSKRSLDQSTSNSLSKSQLIRTQIYGSTSNQPSCISVTKHLHSSNKTDSNGELVKANNFAGNLTSKPTLSFQIDAKGYETLLQYLVGIQEQNKHILSLLEQCTLKKQDQGTSINFPVSLPLTTHADLTVLEVFYTENETIVKPFFARSGGENITIATNRILKNIITDELASQYSFFGRKNKKEFGKLKLFHIVKGAVQQIFRNATDHDIEKATKTWLKHAPDRLKKKNKTQIITE